MYTVVVADDEEEIRQALIRRVKWEEAGFEVVGEAANGVEALELVERLEPDLLLSDIKMPFMSGIELARAVREIRPTMQIAFLSGYDDFSYAQQAIQYNIISYMLKPVSSREMTEELKVIRAKIDQKFEEFSKWTMAQQKPGREAFFMSLLLDSGIGENTEAREEQLRSAAVGYELLHTVSESMRYTVVVCSMWDKDGKNCTSPGSTAAIDSILKKYVKYVSFYVEGRVVSLLCATTSGMNKYLSILVEEIAQSVERITGRNTSIGVSRQVEKLSDCHEAYLEAMNAFSHCKGDESSIQFNSDILRLKAFGLEKTKNLAGRGGSLISDQALDLIERKYADQELSLVSISSEIAVTPNYLSALIKKSTGHTFIELLTAKRMEVAKTLLDQGELKIREIAQQCGYNDQHYFSYCFKRHTGLSPNACRRQNEEDKQKN